MGSHSPRFKLTLRYSCGGVDVELPAPVPMLPPVGGGVDVEFGVVDVEFGEVVGVFGSALGDVGVVSGAVVGEFGVTSVPG